MSWRNSEMAEESDAKPTLKLSMLSEGSKATVSFEDDGEMVETQYGDAVEFHIVVEHLTEDVDTGDEEIEYGDEATLFTSSSVFLANLAGIEDLEGETVIIHRLAEGFDTEYELQIQD